MMKFSIYPCPFHSTGKYLRDCGQTSHKRVLFYILIVRMTAELLGKVQYSNLLHINWNEQKIQTNFRLIVEALQTQQQDSATLKDQLTELREEIGRVEKKVDNKSSKEIAARPASGADRAKSQDSATTLELRNGFQKKLAELREKMAAEVGSLRNDIDGLRRQLSDSDRNTSNPPNAIPTQPRPPSGTPARNPSLHSLKNLSQSDHADLLELKSKFDTLFEGIDKLKNDNLGFNAKLNVLQQMLDRGAVRRDSVKVERSSKTNIKTSAAEDGDGDDGGNNFDGNQISNLLIDMGTLRLCYEELKLVQTEMKKTEDKRAAKVDHLHEKMDALRHGMEHERDRVDRQFKNLKIAIASLPSSIPSPTLPEPPAKPDQSTTPTSQPPQPQNPTTPSNNSASSQRRDSQNVSGHINDRISKLHQLMLESANQNDLERLRDQFNEKIRELAQVIEKELPILQDGVGRLEGRIQALEERIAAESVKQQQEIEKMALSQQEKFAGVEKKHNSNASKIQDLRKDLQYVKEDLDYYKGSLLKTDSIHTPSNPNSSQQADDPPLPTNSQSSLQLLRKRIDDLKRQHANKLHDLRSQLINAIRDFQRRMSNKANSDQQIGQLHQKFEQIKLYLNRKADVEDTKKSLVYLDKKLSLVLNSLNREDENVEDARLAKKSWFCLSCDKVLEGYSGKVGKHIPWDALSPKNVLKITQLGNSNKIEGAKRKDPLPTLNKKSV